MVADFQLGLHDYLSIARRWAWVIALTFVAVVAGSVVVALLTPRVYESWATLIAEGPQIASDAVPSAASAAADQRIQTLSQRLLTRENLLSLAHKHELFDALAGKPISETAIADVMRESITVRLLTDTSNLWQRPNASITFLVSFQHGKPDKALEVTQALVQMVLEGSTRDRVQQATRTTEFFSQEADRLQSQLESLEQQIAAYKRRQGGALAETQAFNVSGIQTLEADLRAAERDHRLALEELRSLEVELQGARAGVLAPGTVAPSEPSVAEQELERARAELARLRAIYTEDHPDVRAQVRRIGTLQDTVSRAAQSETPARAAAAAQVQMAISRLEARISATQSRADLLYDQQVQLRSSIGQMRSQLIRAPQVERDLAALQRDYDAAQTKYEDLRARQMSAQIAENLEGVQQGERITVLEPPVMPEYPIKPSRTKMVLLGFFLAIAASIGVTVLLEMLFGRVRGLSAVTALTGQRPLVVIPYITTTEELRSNQALRRRMTWAGVGLAVLLLATVHVFITPLPVLLVRLFAVLG
jgi:polysaccharide chain length determinant protein (PEP-CTERM system associated)